MGNIRELFGIVGDRVRWERSWLLFAALLAAEVVGALLWKLSGLILDQATRSDGTWKVLPLFSSWRWTEELSSSAILVLVALAVSWRIQRTWLALPTIAACYVLLARPVSYILSHAELRTLLVSLDSPNLQMDLQRHSQDYWSPSSLVVAFLYVPSLFGPLVVVLRTIRSRTVALLVGAAVGGALFQLLRVATWWVAGRELDFAQSAKGIMVYALAYSLSFLLFLIDPRQPRQGRTPKFAFAISLAVLLMLLFDFGAWPAAWWRTPAPSALAAGLVLLGWVSVAVSFERLARKQVLVPQSKIEAQVAWFARRSQGAILAVWLLNALLLLVETTATAAPFPRYEMAAIGLAILLLCVLYERLRYLSSWARRVTLTFAWFKVLLALPVLGGRWLLVRDQADHLHRLASNPWMNRGGVIDAAAGADNLFIARLDFLVLGPLLLLFGAWQVWWLNNRTVRERFRRTPPSRQERRAVVREESQ